MTSSRFLMIALPLVTLSLVACGGGGSSSTPPPSNYLLASLMTSLSQPLAPGFDPATSVYTLGPAITPDSVVVTPASQDAGVSITVNCVAVASGLDSAPVALASRPPPRRSPAIVARMAATSVESSPSPCASPRYA